MLSGRFRDRGKRVQGSYSLEGLPLHLASHSQFCPPVSVLRWVDGSACSWSVGRWVGLRLVSESIGQLVGCSKWSRCVNRWTLDLANNAGRFDRSKHVAQLAAAESAKIARSWSRPNVPGWIGSELTRAQSTAKTARSWSRLEIHPFRVGSAIPPSAEHVQDFSPLLVTAQRFTRLG